MPHERALEYVKAFPGHGKSLKSDDQLANYAWCGFFLAWCLKRAGYAYPEDPLSLEDWKEVTVEVDEPHAGDIAIMSGHVAFYYRRAGDEEDFLLGGNQPQQDPLGILRPEDFTQKVSIIRVDRSQVNEYRRPIRPQ